VWLEHGIHVTALASELTQKTMVEIWALFFSFFPPQRFRKTAPTVPHWVH